MIGRAIAGTATLSLALGLMPSATAVDPDASSGEGTGSQLYIVQLEESAVPAYAGGVKGLAPVHVSGRSFTPEAARERAYRRHVLAEQGALRADIAGVTGRPAEVRFSYTDAINGLAVRLTRAEAREVSELEGVAAVHVDEVLELHTDRGPAWIGAPSIWSGEATPTGIGTKGEGVVVGVLDTGINPANPSFAEVVSEEDGGDGYVHENPLGPDTFVGVCDPAEAATYIADWGCNDKLIGAWDFAPDDDDNPYDNIGHGTHTASTAAGNQVAVSGPFSATLTIQGVAPHANLIAYDVCDDEGCPLTAIVAGIDQAILDGVDVINYSIGRPLVSRPWTHEDSLGFLNARAAGIHVATSAGNDGPGAATVESAGDVPWITTVGATRHDRQWRATVQEITTEGGATLPDIAGLAYADATDGAFPLVYAGELGSPQCLDEDLAGVDLTGQIVVCDRGTTGRVVKGRVVEERGAEGMILVNNPTSGDSLIADQHVLPAVHVTYDDGSDLKDWMTSVEGEQASLSGAEAVGGGVADIMAGFSSRGPNRAVEMITPSISAPGVEILAAAGVDNQVEWGLDSGTSMASPHVAGSLALLASANPGWTPAEAQSALMTTAVTDIDDHDNTPADWFDMGSGRVDLQAASKAGLVLDVTEADYLEADPAMGGDVKTLNTASMADKKCRETCTWTRTVEATETGAGPWTATGSAASEGIDVTVEPTAFDLAAGETQQITVTVDVDRPSTEEYQFGTVVLTPGVDSDAPEAHLPIAVVPWTDPAISVRKRRDAKEPRRNGIVVLTRPAWAVGERLTVRYRVGGNAEPGRRYRKLDGKVTFAAGHRRTREVVKVIKRKGRQRARRVVITLVDGGRYSVRTPRRAVVRVLDRMARG